jgi:hypothetical protein
MTSVFGTLVIGATPVQVPFTGTGVCKLFLQIGPGATGGVKIGGAGVTINIPDTTPGTWLSSSAGTNADTSLQPGGSWVIESQEDKNTVHPGAYFIHGTHAGDLVNYEYHTN